MPQNGAISEQQLGAKKLHYRKRNDKKEELLMQKKKEKVVTGREKKNINLVSFLQVYVHMVLGII